MSIKSLLNSLFGHQAGRGVSASVAPAPRAALSAKGTAESSRASIDASTHVGRARTLLRKGDVPSAIAEFQESIRMKPDDAGSHEGLGSALSVTGRSLEAIREYREAIRLSPNAHAHVCLANELLHGLGLIHQTPNLKGALAEYRAAIALEPAHTMAHFFLGQALRDMGDLDGAASEFWECVRLSPDDPDSHCELGDTLEKAGNFDDAAVQYYTARSLAPRDPDIREMYQLLEPEMIRRIRRVARRSGKAR